MGVGRIKGITVEIGGDTTKLQTALKGVNTEIKNTQSQLKDVEKLLKLDPGNTELLSQKQKLLADAVSETKQKLETLKTAAEQANQALANGDISQEQYDALQREIVETEQELKKLEDQAKESGAALQEIAAKGEKLKTVGENISDVGEKFLPATAAVAGLGAAAVKTAADFDTGMSKVAAISGATGDDLDALREKAREMGSKTKFSASEAASAMEYMAMAGWKTEDMLGGIEGIMNLAAASGEDLATTSDIVTDALTAFGLSAQDSGHFADILAAASSNANTNVSLMGETFKYCAPIAGALGFSAEDTAEAIGLMANAGIKGSQAGTALRTIMNNMAGPIDIAGEALGQVTIQTTNADGSMRDLSDILADCRVAFSQLSESEQANAAESLVGKNAMSGFLALMNAGEGDINKLSDAIANCDGKSAEMAETMQDNLAGQLTILKSQLEELAISFGEMLMPVIRDVVGWIQGLVNKLNSMDEGQRKTIITIAAVVAAIGPVLIIIGKVVSAVGTIMTIIPKLSAAITTVKGVMAGLNATMLANPIFLIIAAIIALVAAFIYLWNNCEEFRQFWINLWESIKSFVSSAVEAIKNFFSGIIDFVKENWQGLLLLLVNPFAGAFKLLYDNCEGFREFIDNFLAKVKEIFVNVGEGIKNAVSAAWNWIKETIGGVMQSIWDTITSIWTSIYETISPLLEAFQYLFETIFQAIQILIGMAMDWISEKISAAWNAIVEFLTPILTAIHDFFQTIWTAICNVVSTAMSAIQNVISTVWNAISSAVASVLSAIGNVVSTAWNNIKSVISTVMSAIGNVVSTAWNNIKNSISTVMNTIKTTVTSIWTNIKTAVGNTINGIVTTIQNGFNNAVNFIRNLASQAYTWGRDIIMGIVNGIKSAISAVANAVRSVADTIRSWLHFSVPDVGPLTDYESWMPDFMGGLAKGIEKSRGLVQKAIGDVSADMVVSPNLSGGASMTETINRSEQNGTLVSLLGEYLPYLPKLAEMKMVTDTGALVGQLAPQMDERLGVMAMRQRRQ